MKQKTIWVPAKFIKSDGTVEEYSSYEVSNHGDVRSLNYNHTGKPRILSKVKHVWYYQVGLSLNRKTFNQRCVHRLVISSFNPSGFFKGCVVDHIDSNPLNNELSNLRWVTQKENTSTTHRRELTSAHQRNDPKKSKKVKVTKLDTGEIMIFPSASEVSRYFGMPNKMSGINVLRSKNHIYSKLNIKLEYCE